MKNKQLYDRYISEIDDVVSKKLYDDIILGEHGYDHMNMVLLNSMYMGNKLNLTSKEMDILIESAKFHDCGLKGNKTDKGHAKISALIAEKYLNGKYSTKEVAFIKSIIEYHEIEDSLEDLKNICYNNGIYDIDEINDVKKIANILKDADGIDRIRFPGNLNFQKIRNKEIAKEIILADYDLREKMATEELLELISVQNNINNKNIEEVQFLMNSGQFPNYIIKFAYKYYKNFGWDNITEYANAIINSGTFSVRRKK